MEHQLHYSPGACSLAVHIMLEELGVPYILVPRVIAQGGTTSAEYLAINPKGKVPALGIPGATRVLTELPAIMDYLVGRFDHKGLVPVDPLERARCFESLVWIACVLHGVGYGELWRPHRFVRDEGLHEAIVSNGKVVIQDTYEVIESLLKENGGYAAGDAYTVADPYLFVMFRWGVRIGLPMKSTYPTWFEQTMAMSERPAVQRALRQEGLNLFDKELID